MSCISRQLNTFSTMSTDVSDEMDLTSREADDFLREICSKKGVDDPAGYTTIMFKI
jgi:hypothetical protein